ncbi:hypothetical protein [Sessilibacter corallicola]|uniref:Porin n=1 Tax=Sessilibacter corallicola TaxID=2904075 RepID=A0ABQ0A6I8_9GAMM|nr:hypothetical protein [Sessilibacter corallicola]MCE2028682.1 hypothetical protein [Sessilibacter corallicola]
MWISKKQLSSAVIIASTLAPVASFAADDTVEVKVGGFIRADYGDGDRYSEEQGEDRLGVTKAALAAQSTYKNVTGVLVFGTEILTDGDEDADGNVDVKDAFIVLNNVGDSAVSFSVGAQPLLFGLKPEGYPGDHSIQASIEYGAGGLFATSNQAGPAIISWVDFGEFTLRGGVFDLNSTYDDVTFADFDDDGSSVSDNLFLQLRGTNIAGTGLYGVIGAESIFVDPENDGESITTVGLGWTNDVFDISAEFQQIDEAIIEAGGIALDDDETYLIVEASVKANDKLSFYADYSEADEVEFETFRFGVDYLYNKFTVLSAEWSQDEFDDGDDIDSIDFRIALKY